MNEVKERVLPELNDELAKKAGKETLDALKEDIQKYIDDNFIEQKFIDLNPDELKIGQNVLVKKLEQVVILESLPDKKGNVDYTIKRFVVIQMM